MYAVSYMGTKRQLADTVRDLVTACRPGPFLDLFSGMCSVAHAIAPHRPVWSNDLQHFAHAMAQSTFCADEHPPSALELASLIGRAVEHHTARLTKRWKSQLEAEETALSIESCAEYLPLFTDATQRANRVKATPSATSYDVFVKRFAGTYFSYRQAIEFDALRFALDTALTDQRITSEAYRWAIIALCISLSKCSTTTGHFAQPLKPKENTFVRFKAQRARSLYQEWFKSIELVAPVGSRRWRKKNRAYQGDSLALLPTLAQSRVKPSVVYADPPYTKDQYSRYYHVYETAILYDYPVASGNGLYRGDRASSSFSSQAQIESSLEELIRLCSDIRADLILSYPTNGLLEDSITTIPNLIRRHYKRRPLIVTVQHAHSTMGASKGLDRKPVTEVLYKASFK